MKPLILALLLLLPVFASGQDSVIRDYDRFENRTRYWTTPIRVQSGLDLYVHFSFKGKGAGREINGFYLIFESTSSDWRFLKQSNLYCLIDGQPLNLGPPVAKDNDVRAGYRSVSVEEHLMFAVKYQTLQKLAKANQIEMRLGKAEFYLGSSFQASLKELLSKVQVVKTNKLQ